MNARPDWQPDFASVIHRIEQGMAGQQDADYINDYVDRLWEKLEQEEMKNGY